MVEDPKIVAFGQIVIDEPEKTQLLEMSRVISATERIITTELIDNQRAEI
jgi:hypothetical protein